MIVNRTYSESKIFVGGGVVFLIFLIASFLLDIPILYFVPVALCLGALLLVDIRFGFILLVASIPLSVQYLDQYDFPDEPLMLLNTICFLFFLLFNYKRIDYKKILLNPVIIFILLSFVWLLVVVIFSQNPALSVKFLLKKIWYLVPFLFLAMLLFRQQQVIIKTYQFLFAILLVIVMIVLFRHSAVGFAFDKVHDPVQPFFQNHVMYGSMVSVVLPFTVVALFLSRKLSVQWLVSLFGIVVFLSAIYFSYSRAAWMAVLFSLICVILVRLKLMHIAILVFYMLVLTGVLWMSHQNRYLSFKPKFEKTIMHESLEDHIMATIQGTDISSAERYYRWIAALRLSEDHPVVGVGPNNFYDYYKPYTITSFRTWVSRNPERSTTHNYFLFMLVEQGYVGMLLYACLIFFIFYYGQRVYHRQSSKFAKLVIMGALGCFGAIFVNNFFSELLETDKIGSLFFMSIAVIIALDFVQRAGIEKPVAATFKP